MSSLIPFSFESQSIRVLNVEGAPQFVAKDVAEALEYTWTGTQRVAHVPEEWRGVTSVVTPSGVQEMLTLSEPGLYFFVNRSDKPKALPFQKWVAGEVLPAIRQTGGYVAQPMPTPHPDTLTLPREEYRALVTELETVKRELDLHVELRGLYQSKLEWLEERSGLTPKRRPLSVDERTTIVLLSEQGQTHAAIGARIGRSKETVCSYLRARRLEG